MNATFSAGNVSFGLVEYTSDLASLSTHESPEWFDQAKFGIFIRGFLDHVFILSEADRV
jgi:hypothetical protein